MTSRLVLAALTVAIASAVASAQKAEEVEKQVLKEVNAHREKKKLAKLATDDKLQAIAQAHARAMARADKFGDRDENGHFLDGKGPKERFEAAGYKHLGMAENVGWNLREKDPAGVMMQTWLESPPHEKNIANKDLTHVGIGAALGKSGRWYFVQVFARPADNAPAAVKVTVTVANLTKQPITLRIGRNKYDLPAGEKGEFTYAQEKGPIQIFITWPEARKEEAHDLTDKAAYAIEEKEKGRFTFRKADAK